MCPTRTSSSQEDYSSLERGEYQELDRRESQESVNLTLPTEDAQLQNGRYSPLNIPNEMHQSEDTLVEDQRQDDPSNPSSDTDSLHSTSKWYNHRESRKFLLWTGFNRLCVTVFLCVFIGLTLSGFQGFDHRQPRALSKSDVRTFNAIILGLSLALGFNIASSLKHYGLLLRWSILTKRFLDLQAFDLILGCENLTSVLKLMVMSFPGIDRIPPLQLPFQRHKAPFWHQKLPWRGAKYTWLVCLTWLLINVGAQALVATLSIFWPVDTLDNMPLTGNISISNLETWHVDSFPLQLSSANLYGISASQYPIYTLTDALAGIDSTSGASILRGNGYYEYQLVDRNPADMSSDSVASRTIQAIANCTQLAFNEEDGKIVKGMVEASLDDGKTWNSYNIIRAVGGQITYTGILSSTCGPRCTTLLVYQRADHKAIKENSMFMCNSTVSKIQATRNIFTSLRAEDNPHVESTDSFARIAAGAIAWNGYFDSGNHDNQTKTYPNELSFSPNRVVSAADVEDLISRFTIGAIAAFDDHGPRYTISNPQIGPVRDQLLRVDWLLILTILSSICLVQFTVLLAMLAFANKSIIRDESFFSVAALLSPIMKRIGSVGINLSGEEIMAHPALCGKRIRYDYVKVRVGGRKLNKVDLVFEGEDLEGRGEKKQEPWADGEYQ